MIDVENEVFTSVRNRVKAEIDSAFVVGEFTASPAKFPCVSIVEKDNSVYTRTISSSSRENHNSLLYEVNVYSNLDSGKKAQAKAIMQIVSDAMLSMGFIRTMCQPIYNLQDSKIYRITARFTAVIDKDKFTYTT